jgi:hypothetical protein
MLMLMLMLVRHDALLRAMATTHTYAYYYHSLAPPPLSPPQCYHYFHYFHSTLRRE